LAKKERSLGCVLDGCNNHYFYVDILLLYRLGNFKRCWSNFRAKQVKINMGLENKLTHKWYIVNAASGQEKKVATAIKDKAAEKGMTDFISEVAVPAEEAMEVRRGKKVATEKKFFPGYVMVKMEMNDQAWHLVKNVPKVTGFLGAKDRPQAISNAEAEAIFAQVREGVKRVEEGFLFEAGETVKVIDGPFESFAGVVTDIDFEKKKLKVEVSIFGRATPVELKYEQVKKM